MNREDHSLESLEGLFKGLSPFSVFINSPKEALEPQDMALYTASKGDIGTYLLLSVIMGSGCKS